MAISPSVSDFVSRIKPGLRVLYIGAAAGTTVSHVSDVVGPEGAVYAVEFSHRPGRDLVNLAKKRTNVIPIIEDARYPQKYRKGISSLFYHLTSLLFDPLTGFF